MISLVRILYQGQLLKLKETRRIQYPAIIHGNNQVKNHYNLFKNLVQRLKCFFNFTNP